MSEGGGGADARQRKRAQHPYSVTRCPTTYFTHLLATVLYSLPHNLTLTLTKPQPTNQPTAFQVFLPGRNPCFPALSTRSFRNSKTIKSCDAFIKAISVGVLSARPGLIAASRPIPALSLVATQIGGVRRLLVLISLVVATLTLVELGDSLLVLLGGRARFRRRRTTLFLLLVVVVLVVALDHFDRKDVVVVAAGVNTVSIGIRVRVLGDDLNRDKISTRNVIYLLL